MVFFLQCYTIDKDTVVVARITITRETIYTRKNERSSVNNFVETGIRFCDTLLILPTTIFE